MLMIGFRDIWNLGLNCFFLSCDDFLLFLDYSKFIIYNYFVGVLGKDREGVFVYFLIRSG